MLVTAPGTESMDRRSVGGMVPDWVASLKAPYVETVQRSDLSSSFATVDCPPNIEFWVPSSHLAPRFDSARGVSEIYVYEPGRRRVVRHDVDSMLNHTSDTISLSDASPWIAEDLDQDGQIELVCQWADQLMIYSAPDWTLRAGWIWPGFDVVMDPIAVNLDADRFTEIFVTPHTLGGTARAVLIKYDSLSGTFLKIADVEAPLGAKGRPAAADFDSDGRMEFISAHYSGYSLFEWQDPVLIFVGSVGAVLPGSGNFNAVACRPKPDGIVRALLGHSSGNLLGFYYQLLLATGDNTFEVEDVFQEFTGFIGITPCHAADTDCDGLDELLMTFHPTYKVWQWEPGLEQYELGCSWSADVYGALMSTYDVDFNGDISREWGLVNHEDVFRAFPDPECLCCDSSGTCAPPSSECYCFCLSDPVCDGVSNVLDVVKAVDVAFRSAASQSDPFPQCPHDRTDVDCSNDTDILDVVHLVNVTFRGADPLMEFCEPCP